MRINISKKWLLWFLVAAVQFYQGCLISFPSIMALQIKDEVLIDSSGLGIIFAVFLFATLLIQLPGGLILDYFGNKNAIILLLVLMVSGCVFFAVATSFLWVIVGTVLLGCGTGMSYISVIHFSKSWLPDNDFPRTLYFTTIMGTAGFVIGSTAMAFLNKFQSLLFISGELAVIGLILLLFITWFVPPQIPKGIHKSAYTFQEVLGVIGDKRVLLIGLYTGGIFCQYSVLSNMWRVPYLTSILKISIAEATTYNNLTLIGFFVGCFVCTWLSNYIRPTTIMITAAIIQLFILNVIYLFPFDIYRLILLVCLGAICAPTIFSYELIKDYSPAKCFGIASGFLTILFDSFGTILGYILGGLTITDVNHLTSTAMALISAANVIGLLALLWYLKIIKNN